MKKADFGKVISLAIMIIGGVALAANKKKKKQKKRNPLFLWFLIIFFVVILVIIFVYSFMKLDDSGEYLYGELVVRDDDVYRKKPTAFSLPLYDDENFKIPSTGMDSAPQRSNSVAVVSIQPASEPVVNEPVVNLPFWWVCDECGNCRDSFGNEWYDVTSPFDRNRCE